MQQQFGLLHQLVEATSMREEVTSMCQIAMSGLEVKLAKLSPQDNAKTYLTTFERVMGAYEVELTGKAQQAYIRLWNQMRRARMQPQRLQY